MTKSRTINYPFEPLIIEETSEKEMLALAREAREWRKRVKKMSEKEKLELVRNHGTSISSFDSPSEELQLAAIENNWEAFELIEHPTPRVQLRAVKMLPSCITHIDNPEEKIMLAQVKEYEYDDIVDYYECDDAPWMIYEPTAKVIAAMLKKHKSFVKDLHKYPKAVRKHYMDLIESSKELKSEYLIGMLE